MTNDHQLMTVQEVAELFRTTPGSVYSSRSRGLMPYALGFHAGKKVLYRRVDIERWIDSTVNDLEVGAEQ